MPAAACSPEPPRPVAVAFSPDERTLVGATDQPTIEVWDTASGERTGVLASHSATAGAVGFGADGNTLYSSGTGGTAITWDLAGDRRLVRQVAPPDRTPYSLKTHVAPSPDGTRLSYLNGDQVDHFAVRGVGVARLPRTPKRPPLRGVARLDARRSPPGHGGQRPNGPAVGPGDRRADR